MSERYIARISADPHVETIFHVSEVRERDTTLTAHVYARNEENAIRALQSLHKAIGALLKDCKKGRMVASTPHSEFVHAGITWPLDTSD